MLVRSMFATGLLKTSLNFEKLDFVKSLNVRRAFSFLSELEFLVLFFSFYQSQVSFFVYFSSSGALAFRTEGLKGRSIFSAFWGFLSDSAS